MTTFDPDLLDDIDTDAFDAVLEDPELLWGEFDPDYGVDE